MVKYFPFFISRTVSVAKAQICGAKPGSATGKGILRLLWLHKKEQFHPIRTTALSLQITEPGTMELLCARNNRYEDFGKEIIPIALHPAPDFKEYLVAVVQPVVAPVSVAEEVVGEDRGGEFGSSFEILRRHDLLGSR